MTGGLDDSAAGAAAEPRGRTVIRGTGRITAAPGPVEVTGRALAARTADGTTLTYSDLVIATGCEPVAPPIEGLADIPAWTTAQSLTSPDLPRRLIVLGGGAAGCELTQIYALFGSQVTLVEAEPALLPGEPALRRGDPGGGAAPGRGGDPARLPASKAERTSEGLTLALEDGTRIDADRLLLAHGPAPAARRPRPGRARPRGHAGDGAAHHHPVRGGRGRRSRDPGLGRRRRHRHRFCPCQPLPGRRGRGEHPRRSPRGRLQRDPAVRVHHALGVRGRHRPGRDGRRCRARCRQHGQPGSRPGERSQVRRMLRIARVPPDRAEAPTVAAVPVPGARLVTAGARLERHHPGAPGPGRPGRCRALRGRRDGSTGRRGRGGAGRGQLDGRGYARHQGQDSRHGPCRRRACLSHLRGSTGDGAAGTGGNRGRGRPAERDQAVERVGYGDARGRRHRAAPGSDRGRE